LPPVAKTHREEEQEEEEDGEEKEEDTQTRAVSQTARYPVSSTLNLYAARSRVL
ncbi:uncharacterized, partial [Tachysurus ichikawai]